MLFRSVLAVPLTTAIGVAVVRASAAGRRSPALAGVPAEGGSADTVDDETAEKPAEKTSRLKLRRRKDDEFDDFSDLRDPDDDAPKGRRSL